MLYRALLCLFVACSAFGSQQEIMFDGVKIIVPSFPGLESVDPKEEWYKERAEIFADTRQFYAILHGHEDDFCMQLFVTGDKETKDRTFTSLKEFKKDHPDETGVKHLTNRLWLFQTTDPKILSAHMLCSGKVVECMLSRFRNENEKNKEMLPTTEEDERRFLAWCQALVASNPALTPQQQKDADNADHLNLIFVLTAGGMLSFFLFLKVKETRAKAQMPWTSGKHNGF